MLKQLAICDALLALATVPVAAQQQEAVLQRMRVSGAAFDIVLAMPKSPPQWMDGLNMSPDAVVEVTVTDTLRSKHALDDRDRFNLDEPARLGQSCHPDEGGCRALFAEELLPDRRQLVAVPNVD